MAARSFSRLRGRVVLPVLLCLLLAPPVYAGGFQITPMLIEVPTGSSIATYTVRNTGNQAVNIQVSAFRWTQSGNQDHYASAPHLMVIPQILSVPPGGQQLVRVALRSARPPHEMAYRLHFDQIPPAPKKGFIGVQTVIDMDLPLFFLPPHVSNSFRIQLSRKARGKAAMANIHNTGTRFLRISNLVLLNAAGEEVGKLRGPLYVLPGMNRHWTFDIETGKSPLVAGTYRLKIVSDGKQQTRRLTLQ